MQAAPVLKVAGEIALDVGATALVAATMATPIPGDEALAVAATASRAPRIIGALTKAGNGIKGLLGFGAKNALQTAGTELAEQGVKQGAKAAVSGITKEAAKETLEQGAKKAVSHAATEVTEQSIKSGLKHAGSSVVTFGKNAAGAIGKGLSQTVKTLGPGIAAAATAAVAFVSSIAAVIAPFLLVAGAIAGVALMFFGVSKLFGSKETPPTQGMTVLQPATPAPSHDLAQGIMPAAGISHIHTIHPAGVGYIAPPETMLAQQSHQNTYWRDTVGGNRAREGSFATAEAQRMQQASQLQYLG